MYSLDLFCSVCGVSENTIHTHGDLGTARKKIMLLIVYKHPYMTHPRMCRYMHTTETIRLPDYRKKSKKSLFWCIFIYITFYDNNK